VRLPTPAGALPRALALALAGVVLAALAWAGAAAFASDCAPHWGPADFLAWEGYPRFWGNLVEWLARA